MALAFSASWLLIILARKLCSLMFASSFALFVCLSFFACVSGFIDSRRQVGSCPGYRTRLGIVDENNLKDRYSDILEFLKKSWSIIYTFYGGGRSCFSVFPEHSRDCEGNSRLSPQHNLCFMW